jgi:SAM-dependent methyltransferase
MDLDEIKKHWVNWAKEFETDLRATTKSTTIKKLEINALYKAIQETHPFPAENIEVLEVGCGNGYNCLALSDLFPYFNFTGVDFVPEMIENAKNLQSNSVAKYSRITFHVGDILKLENNKNLKEKYHFVFTDRCIINLNTLDLQLKAFDQLLKKVEKYGYLIILENTVQNYQRQNDCRVAAGLPGRVPARYNLFLDEDKFLDHAKNSTKLVHVDDFGSLHDLILYVLIPMINNGEIDYDHPVVKAATELSISISGKYDNPFGNFGQNRLFLFQKTTE